MTERTAVDDLPGGGRISLARYLWAAPASALGLGLALPDLPRGGARMAGGILEVDGPVLRWGLTHLVPLPGGAAAVTLGHVVLGRDRQALEASRTHERVHVRQYERWGPLLVPAYLLASVWAWARGGHFYLDNVFEREAQRG